MATHDEPALRERCLKAAEMLVEAGDTVIAAYALALASGLTFEEAAVIANHAGGIVVMKKGTAVAYTEELVDSIVNEAGSLSSHAN